MLRKAKFFATAILASLTATALVGMDARPAQSLEPVLPSQIVTLVAIQNGVGEIPCPNDGAAFARVTEDGTEETHFVVPDDVVFVATAFEWSGSGGVPSVTQPGILSMATVLAVTEVGLRARIKSTAIADDVGDAGNWLNIPNGVLFRPDPEKPICLFAQQGNEQYIAAAFLYGFVTGDVALP